MNRIIRFFLENKFISILLLIIFSFWGMINAPFNRAIAGCHGIRTGGCHP